MPAPRRLFPLLMALMLFALPGLAESRSVPYLQKVARPDEMIFSGPSYDEFCVGFNQKLAERKESRFFL